MKKGRKEVSAFSSFASNSIAKIGAGIAAFVAVDKLKQSFFDAAEAIDATGKAAERLGVGTEAMVGLQHGAELSGVTTQQLDTGLSKLNRTIGDAKIGLESAKRPFESLGLSMKQVADVPLDQALGMIADRLNAIESPADRTRIAMELFGRGGAPMLSFLKEGSAGMEAFKNEAEKLGITFSSENFKQVEKFNDDLARLKKTLGGAIQGIVIDISPAAIKAIENLMVALGKGPNAFQGTVDMMSDEMFGKLKSELDGKTFGEADAIFEKFGMPTAETTWSEMAMGHDTTGVRRQQYLDSVLARIEADRQAKENELAALSAGPGKTLSGIFSPASTMLQNTVKNIAKIGNDGAKALGLGAKWNQLQQAALLASFVKNGVADPEAIKKLGQSRSSGFELTRSGSVESYRQRAAIGSQNNPLLKVGKDQLAAQNRTAVAVEQIARDIVPMQPANIA